VGYNAEVAPPDRRCPTCGATLAETKGIEVGNTFDLGTKYSSACEFKFTDAAGEQRPVLMGCYGIGITRLVGAIVEAHHDERGIVWPAGVSPFAVHVIAIPGKIDETSERVFAAAEVAVDRLETAGVDVLYDDRQAVSAGVKFADADLIGVSKRAVVSERSLAAGGFECGGRAGEEPKIVTTDQLLQALCE
jgi:prolyl-tRNA synthetase